LAPVNIWIRLIAPTTTASLICIGQPVRIKFADGTLGGMLYLPPNANRMVIFVHTSSSACLKNRNYRLAQYLAARNFGILRVEMHTGREQVENRFSGDDQYCPTLFAKRLLLSVQWLHQQRGLENFPVGFLGFGPGGTVVLMAAAALAATIDAVVSVDGLPDLVADRLACIRAATLLVVSKGSNLQWRLNEIGYARLRCEKRLAAVSDARNSPSATGSDRIGNLAEDWLQHHLFPQKTVARSQRFSELKNSTFNDGEKTTKGFRYANDRIH